MSKSFNITYDSEVDILMIMSTEREYDSSVQDGNLVLDLDRKGNHVGLEILDASDTFKKSKDGLVQFFSKIKD